MQSHVISHPTPPFPPPVVASTVESALNDENVVRKLYTALTGDSLFRLRGWTHDLLHKRSFQAVVLGTSLFHMLMSFVEAGFEDTLRGKEEELLVSVLSIEGLILLVYWIVIVLYWFSHRLLHLMPRDDPRAIRIFIGDRNQRIRLGIIKLVIVVLYNHNNHNPGGGGGNFGAAVVNPL